MAALFPLLPERDVALVAGVDRVGEDLERRAEPRLPRFHRPPAVSKASFEMYLPIFSTAPLPTRTSMPCSAVALMPFFASPAAQRV
ncbi:hypothetical protein Ae717Ps2_7226c [Pseudonocardia sp. Ae717_Ps2]|uniref:hypothetical protein n=1 Tax=Pseudonocardia sp. Ae717_Ps2 TaxID=1885573 RepID=UPI00094AE22B|nr:hypothetical protein [Pseudonocardia sp. Ae717_Ps2]OLM27682.1 hypothetical protein Ae717Ps2_7226c [Pseudonocardia sp. Ae717_Ps2]